MASVARINLYGWNAQEKQSLADRYLDDSLKATTYRDSSTRFFIRYWPMIGAPFCWLWSSADFAGLYRVVGSEAVSKYEFERRPYAFEFWLLDPDKLSLRDGGFKYEGATGREIPH